MKPIARLWMMAALAAVAIVAIYSMSTLCGHPTMRSPSAEEATIMRSFTLYDYKRNDVFRLVVKIPVETYLYYRLRMPHEKMTLTVRFGHAKRLVRESIGVLSPLSHYILEEKAGGDDELYANLVLQMSRQIRYEKTLYSKWPVETLAEGSGDCDNTAVLAATLLEAAGIDSAVALAIHGDEVHALLAVNMTIKDARTEYGIWRIMWNDKRYFLADTSIDLGTKPGTMPPGFLLGENPEDYSILEIVDV